MTASTTTGVSGHQVGRYILEDLVAENAGTSLWRATDPALRRHVGARLIPRSDPRADQLRENAALAARVHDRRIVRVLDVVETDEHLAIVTEWVNGESWSDLLGERWSALEATVVALEVSYALESAHRENLSHGRIRPDSIMITDTREVRVRGLGVDSILWGVEPSGDPRAADLHGIGAVLYAGMTRCWPNADGSTVDGLRPAPRDGGLVAPPATVSPDVPPELDRIVVRCLADAQLPARTLPFSSVGEVVRALEDAMAHLTPADDRDFRSEDTDRATDRILGRLGTAAVISLAVAGLALLLWQLTVGRADGGVADANVGSYQPLIPPQPPLPESPFAIVAATEFDPEGDGSENPQLVKFAHDRDKSTAWLSESYKSAEPDGKSGVGIVFDLGAVRPIRAIDLKLTAPGADFEIATSISRPTRSKDFRKVVDIIGAGDKINVRTPKAVNGRFVLVKLTRLPFDGDSYVGGLREVSILG